MLRGSYSRMNWPRLARSVAALTVLALCAESAAAPPEPAKKTSPAVELEWAAPPNCPDQETFAALLATAITVPPRERVRVSARVVARGKQFHITIRLDAGLTTGERTLSASSCAELARTAALIIALAIQPLEDDSSEEPVVEAHDDEIPRPITLSTNARDARQEPGPALGERPGRPWGLPFDMAVRLMIGGDSGLLPELAPSVHAVMAALGGEWRIELGGSYVFRQRAPLSADPSMGGLISLGRVTLRGCTEIYRGLALASACAGGELGSFYSTGYGSITPLENSELHAAFSGGIALSWQVRRALYVRLDTEMLALLVRPRFAICPLGSAGQCAVPWEPVWQPESAVARVLAGVEMVFP